ncbi:MAG TPA: tetratricopeptide repeat protein [Burkholderiales bacterium]|nr:tetratricopeptide repeat protein [Burkholderiales bacterium]
MSLLLEALKKAELAKQRAAGTGPVRDPEPAPEAAKPVITREKLPDIGEHVEIHTDDLPSAKSPPAETREGGKPQRLELEMAPDPQPAPRSDGSRGERATAENQDAARRLFEVKEIDYNPRRPFYATLIALGLVAVAYGGYVWWQLQPRYSYNTQAARDAKERPAAASAAAQRPLPPVSAATPASVDSAPGPTAVPVSAPPQQQRSAGPGVRSAAPAVPAPAPAPRPFVPTARAAPGQVAPAPRAADSVYAPEPGPARQSIAINPPSMQIDPELQRAYEAFQANDLETARQIYQGVLQREPSNHDALLGMAAIDVRTRNYETAQARYLRLLELDPRDGYAQAGMLALSQADPVASESRLKNLLAGQPDSPQLLFALGNQYALQSRWSEAQQAYFRALSADPENPDYAFNLAVSLDHLHQKPQAIEFYRRSLALADRRTATFDRALAAARARDLQQR